MVFENFVVSGFDLVGFVVIIEGYGEGDYGVYIRRVVGESDGSKA